MTIPKILHQTWRDADVPRAWAPLQRSWRRHHPGWEHRHWTDEALRELIRADYGWFLPIYDGYPDPIMRVDAARCFLLHRYGGLYVDMDFESLRPIDPLLDGRELVLGCEPHAHLDLHLARERGVERLVCNAFMASTPGHPFWEHAFRELVRYHTMAGALDATGPFFLTRAVESFDGHASVTVLEPELLYPATSADAELGHLKSRAGRARLLRDAYAVHHWSGSWWRANNAESEAEGATLGPEIVYPLVVTERRTRRVSGRLHLPAQPRPVRGGPRVSCLLVTRGRYELARRAIACFLAQTYRERELVIVDDDEDDRLRRYARGLGARGVVVVRPRGERLTLGELRNLAVDRATGEYVCQWDDDDLYGARRLEVQAAALRAFGADACFLLHQHIYWPAARRLARSVPRIWEGSMLARREGLPRYPARRRGEDSKVTDAIVRRGRAVLLDAPDLYTYVAHGSNTFEAAHFEAHWDAAEERYEGRAYADLLRAIAAGLPPRVRRELLADAAAVVAEQRAAAPAPRAAPARAPSRAPEDAPSVLVLTPVKDAAAYLDGYVERLLALDHPRARLSVAFLESDSADGTRGELERRLPALRRELSRAELYSRDFGLRLAVPRWEPSVQRARRSILARSRNLLVSRALRDEAWVLWLDVDVIDYAPDVLARLLDTKERIVAPSCVVERGGAPFDLNSYQVVDERAQAGHVVQGLLQPPRGVGRRYLTDLRDHERVRLDGVGGTMLLVDAELHREGLVFPAAPYKALIETEGLAAMARDLGVTCWGLPQVEIVHASE